MRRLTLLVLALGGCSPAPSGVVAASAPAACPPSIVHIPAGFYIDSAGWAIGGSKEHPAHDDTLPGLCITVIGK